MCARRQREILEAGAKLVRPGGRLVYSTCTFAPEENEQTVAAFLAAHPEFTPEPVDAPWFTPAGTGMYRLWPHKLRGEGHFAAVLRRSGDARQEAPREKPEKLPKDWEDFARALDIRLPDGKPVLFGQSLYWAPMELPDLRGVKVLRPGLALGEGKKGRFEPAHALALWLRSCAVTHSLPAGSDGLRAYLHGEVIPCTAKGWCLVCADGYGIGWGKGDGKVLKNHYPKGLRR